MPCDCGEIEPYRLSGAHLAECRFLDQLSKAFQERNDAKPFDESSTFNDNVESTETHQTSCYNGNVTVHKCNKNIENTIKNETNHNHEMSSEKRRTQRELFVDGSTHHIEITNDKEGSHAGNGENAKMVTNHNLIEHIMAYQDGINGLDDSYARGNSQNIDVRYPDGTVRLRNPHIELMDQDILYHLALGSGSHDLVEMFGDVKFVCMGGTPKRMEQFAYHIMAEIGHRLPCGTTLQDISQYSYRYSMYKVGPVLSISHGMGIPSVGILLHEVIKLMYHARVKDPIFFRIGTCGGVGLEGGTVVISEEAVDGALNNNLELTVLGKKVCRPAKLDKRLIRELKALADPEDPYDTVTGKTMCTYDFYEGQGRLDGAFCDFTEADKMEYMSSVHKAGVVNIEMESLAFASLTHHAGIKAAVVCVTLLDRLKGDQVAAPKEVLEEWQQRPTKLVSRYIKRHLQLKGRISLDGHGSIPVKSPRRFKLVQQESETYD